ncbi:uncharacterized protein [Macrobrachium rosenbergii]|uniref:uncharacterized protein isoform X2 n=1 Tax=Macrobrachium rosenbergii TaxID=79674 RepID=UPI0034D4F43C
MACPTNATDELSNPSVCEGEEDPEQVNDSELSESEDDETEGEIETLLLCDSDSEEEYVTDSSDESDEGDDASCVRAKDRKGRKRTLTPVMPRRCHETPSGQAAAVAAPATAEPVTPKSSAVASVSTTVSPAQVAPTARTRKRTQDDDDDKVVPPVVDFNVSTLSNTSGFRWNCHPQVASVPRTSAGNISLYTTGPTQKAQVADTPHECFSLFFVDEIINEIVKWTNKSIEIRAPKYARKTATLNPVEPAELRALLGLLIFSGCQRNNHLSFREMWDPSTGAGLYCSTMSFGRFEFLLNCLQFDNPETREDRQKTDKFAPVRKIWDIFIQKCGEMYTPSENLTVDEQLLGFRGRCPFKMYIRNKHQKRGLKLMLITDSKSNYLLGGIPYLGKQETGASDFHNLGHYFIKELTRPYHNTSRNVTTDSWFTSVPLVSDLLNNCGMTVVGTVRGVEKEIAKEIKRREQLEHGSSACLFNEEMTLTSHVPLKGKTKKSVLLLSSKHTRAVLGTDGTPEIFEFYNQTKGSVSKFDQMCALYSASRNTKRWPLCIFYRILNAGTLNSWIIHCDNNCRSYHKPLIRRKYMQLLAEELIKPWAVMRLNSPFLSRDLKNLMSAVFKVETPALVTDPGGPVAAESDFPVVRCRDCPRSSDRKTRHRCHTCKKAVCPRHYHPVCTDCMSPWSSNAGEGGRGLCSEVPGGEKVFVWDEPDCAQAKGRKTKVPSTTRTNKPVDRRKRKAEIKDSAPQPSTSKTKGSSRKKKKLQREEVEEEKDRKKLKLEEEDWTEETDPLALGHFQEIKIEEEDPLNDPYLLDEEANVLGASGEDLADIASVKQECTSWTDKSDQDTQSVVKAEEDFSQKKITSEQSETKKTGIMGKEVNTLWEKTSEDPARTTKSVPSKRKDNTQQEKSSQEERTAKRHRKVLKENSESDLTEFSQQFTKDVYDVFGMHVAKTLRDINNIEVFNRVKIKINDILLDALAGHFSDPGFKKKASVETQFPPVGEEISNTTPPGISSGHPPSQSFERKALTEKNFSAPKKGSLKTTVPGVSSGLDKTQTSSVDHLVNIPQHSRIPVTLHSINQPTALPVSSSLAETTHTTSVHPFRSASQHSRVPKTTHVVGRPATVPVTFIIPGKTQARTVDPHGTASKLPMIAVLPAASFGLAITQTRPVDPSRSISQSSGVPETAQRSTDATRTSTVDPSASISQHSEIPVTTQTVPHLPPRSISQSSGVPETAQRSTDATQTSTVDPSASISQHSEVPVTTQTVPRLPPRSISQSSGVPETAQRSTDATQTSTVDPSASISQHSEIPVTSKTISHLPQVPGKKKSLSSSESSRILALYNCTCYEEEYPR